MRQIRSSIQSGARRCLALLPVFAVLTAPFLLTACRQQSPIERLSGPTMGSTYQISYVRAQDAPEAPVLHAQIQAMLQQLDSAVSTYRDDSAVARFNAAAAGTCMEMPDEAVELAQHAQQLAADGEGAFDITLLPALDAWGFGPKAALADLPADLSAALSTTQRQTPPQSPSDAPPSKTETADAPKPGQAAHFAEPTPAELDALRPRIGLQHLRIEGTRLCKDAPISIEFNSIAAGYAVDRIADLLAAYGIHNYLVEVTGEIRGAGKKPDGSPWRVAIEAPLDQQRRAQKIVVLDGLSLSTSGDYRHYREVNGQRLSHVIDPRTLRPVTHHLAAVTVATPSALDADGLSTLLMALGPARGLDYAQRHNLPALFVSRTSNGFHSQATPAFEARFPSTGE